MTNETFLLAGEIAVPPEWALVDVALFVASKSLGAVEDAVRGAIDVHAIRPKSLRRMR